ncbi:MAG TPA: hypothetical protein VGP63_19970 [Planctomycetaceae bacterium]|jgi:hypothetical protein|nr:hypothetical protein [Planctomycetaceae bacterium]
MDSLYGDALIERGQAVKSKADFVGFAQSLLENLRAHPNEWENASIDHFLQGLVGFTQSMEGYYENMGVAVDLQHPEWKVFADMLLAARVYE